SPITPGSDTWRTITSWRGSSTVAPRWEAPWAFRNAAYSAPHSAAGRPRKSRMVSRPSTRIPPGRTRTRATSRSPPRISIPAPVPKATSFRNSSCSMTPGILVPTQDVIRGIVAGGHDLYHSGYGAFQIGEPAVGETQAGGGPQGKDRIPADAQPAPGQ